MIYWIILVVLAFNIFFAIKKRRGAPAIVFNGIWLFVLVIYNLKMSYIQQDFLVYTLIIFLTGIFAFNTAYFSFGKVFARGIKKNDTSDKNETDSSTIKKRANVLAIIIAIIFVIEAIYSSGVPLFWKMTGSAKTYFDFGIPTLNGAFYGLVILLGALTLFRKGWYKYLCLAIGILILSRQMIVSIAIEGIFFYILDDGKGIRKKICSWKTLVLAIFFCVFFAAMGNLRSGANVMDKVFQARPQFNGAPGMIKWIYGYTEFSFSNFNNLVGVTHGSGVDNGVSFLKALLPTIFLKKANLHSNIPNYLINPNYNVSTYLLESYADFGIFGVVVLNIVIGALSAFLYYKYKKERSDLSKVWLAICLHNLLFLFFINMFLYLPIIVQWLYSWLFFLKIDRNKIFLFLMDKKNKG